MCLFMLLRTAHIRLASRCFYSSEANYKGWRASWKNMMEDAFSEERIKERQRQVKQDISESYWREFKELKTKGTKFYEASDRLIKAEKAVHVPEFGGTTLSGKRVSIKQRLSGHITLLTFCFAQFGQVHIDSYTKENILKRGILYMSIPYIKYNVPKHHHDNYILCMRNMSDVKRRLSITNTYIGWVFLVDHEQRVRWSAHGTATEKECKSMVELTRVLDERRRRQSELNTL